MRTITRLSVFALLAVTSALASAGDNVQVTASAVTGWPEPAFKLNGNEQTQGTIQLHYVVEAYSFTPGEFARFSLSMEALHLNGAANAVYPATLTLAQNGSSDLVLTPTPAAIPVLAPGVLPVVEVSIVIPPGVPSEDGTDLVGNLNFSIPGQNKIGTPTSVQVHIRLAHPVGCLHAFDFITDTELSTTYESMTVKVNANKGWVSSSNPSQVSDNVLIANSCSWDEHFDLRIELDSRFDTSPSGGHGNAIHTYDSTGIVDADSFALGAFGEGSGQGQNLCLQNVTVPAGTSFLAAVHSSLIHHLDASLLGRAPFGFSASLTEANTGCAGVLKYSMQPNPLLLEIPFVVD
jgi:hypothetical protein